MQWRVFESGKGFLQVVKDVTEDVAPAQKVMLRDPATGRDRQATVDDVFPTVDIPVGISIDVLITWDD